MAARLLFPPDLPQPVIVGFHYLKPLVFGAAPGNYVFEDGIGRFYL